MSLIPATNQERPYERLLLKSQVLLYIILYKGLDECVGRLQRRLVWVGHSSQVFTLFEGLAVKKDTLFKTHKTLKTIPCSAAHTRTGQIRECPPGVTSNRGKKKNSKTTSRHQNTVEYIAGKPILFISFHSFSVTSSSSSSSIYQQRSAIMDLQLFRYSALLRHPLQVCPNHSLIFLHPGNSWSPPSSLPFNFAFQ